jgi:hypothetical protein
MEKKFIPTMLGCDGRAVGELVVSFALTVTEQADNCCIAKHGEASLVELCTRMVPQVEISVLM